MRDIVFQKSKGRGGTVNRTSVHAEATVFRKGAEKKFSKLTRKYLCRNLFFDKVKLCRSATSLATRL